MRRNNIIAKKRSALDFFVNYLLSHQEGYSIAKIILFGSLQKGKIEEESDIDLFIVGLDSINEISKLCDEATLETSLQYEEMVEPIIGCIDEYRMQESYFFRKILHSGENIYVMNTGERAKKEAKNFLYLAEDYYKQAKSNLELRNYRLIVDAGYNAAELCAKGFLILKNKTVPKRHGSIVNQFSNIYIKSGLISREIGKNLNAGLRNRNKARYEYHIEITREKALEALQLAEDLIDKLNEEVA